MTPEHQPDITDEIKSRVEIIEAGKEDSAKTKIITEGDLFLLDRQYDLLVVLSELLSNCLEKEGVTTVKIMIEKGRLVVEDDVVHDNAEAIVSKLNKEFVETTKENNRGGGIWGSRLSLGRRGGKLEYLTEGGRIIAVATWVE